MLDRLGGTGSQSESDNRGRGIQAERLQVLGLIDGHALGPQMRHLVQQLVDSRIIGSEIGRLGEMPAVVPFDDFHLVCPHFALNRRDAGRVELKQIPLNKI